MGKTTDQATKRQVIQLHSQGASFRKVGTTLGINASTAKRIVKRHQEHREDPAIGRPRIRDKFDTRYISRLATSGKCCTATEISNELLNYSRILASPRTVIRALNQNNIISRYKKKKPQLSKTHRRGRREFEKSYRK